MKNCVITGAAGFVGSVLVSKLIERGDFNIKAAVLPGEDVSSLPSQGVEFAVGNITDVDFVRGLICEGDVVFHLASVIDISASGNSAIYDVNVGGTKNIVDACAANGAEKLVYVCSVHTIQPKAAGESMAEPQSFNADLLEGDYAKSKAMAADYVFRIGRERGLNFSVVYPSGIIGPFDARVSNMGQVVLDYMTGKLSAYVSGAYNFVDVRDVADGVIAAYERGRSGEGYILSGNVVTLKEMFTVLAAKLKRKRLPVLLATWFVKMVAPIAEWYYKLKKRKPIISKYSLYTLGCNCNFDNSKAATELGFTPRPAAVSLCDSVDWFLENKVAYMPKRIRRRVCGKVKAGR